MESENVTKRKKNAKLNLSNIESFSIDINSETLNSSSRSLPTTYYKDPEEVSELKKQIATANKELDIAHLEIEKLNVRNTELANLLRKCENKIKYLTKLCTSSPNKSKKRQSTNFSPLRNKDCFTPSFRMIGSVNKQLQMTQSPLKTNQTTSEPYSPIDGVLTSTNIGSSTPNKNYDINDTILSNKPHRKDSLTEKISKADDLELERKQQKQEDCHKTLHPCHKQPGYSSKKSLIILGSEHVSGLATELYDTRRGKWNDEYRPQGYVKPNATTQEILKHCDKVENHLSRQDIVVLSIGNHDASPHHIYSALCIALYKLQNTNVIVLPVIKNKYLNEERLNMNIQLLCKNFDHCNFISMSSIHTNYLKKNKANFVKELCNVINVAIDYSEYKAQYLTFENLIKNRNMLNCFKVSAQQEKHKHIIRNSLDRINDTVSAGNNGRFFRS